MIQGLIKEARVPRGTSVKIEGEGEGYWTADPGGSWRSTNFEAFQILLQKSLAEYILFISKLIKRLCGEYDRRARRRASDPQAEIP